MINEIIQFMEEYMTKKEKYSVEKKIDQITEKYPKIVILNAYFDNEDNTLKMEKDPILLVSKTDKNADREIFEDLEQWLSKNNENIILSNLDFNHYINAMTEKNKCIGSRQGLMTFSPFHFKIREKWLYKSNQNELILLEKLKKHKLSEAKPFIKKELRQDTLIDVLNKENGIRKIYSQGIKRLINIFDMSKKDILYAQEQNILVKRNSELTCEQVTMKSKLKKMIDCLGNIYVYLKLQNYEDLENEIFEFYISHMSFIKEETTKKGICPICDSEEIIGVPSSFNSAILDEKKPLNIHLTQPNPFSIQTCRKCAKMLNYFEQFLKEYKIKFFPLFINEDFRIESINYLKEENKNNFFDILQHIFDISHSSALDFILLHKLRKILYYDYVNNYKLRLGKFKCYFDNFRTFEFTLENLKKKFENKKLIGLNKYFEEIKKAENYRKYLFYKYRLKIFYQVYRNEKTLECSDIKEIIITILEYRIRNKEIELNKKGIKYVRNELLDLYLNSYLFAEKSDKFIQNGGRNMLEEIRKDKKQIIDGGRPTIDSDEKFGYFLGQVIYYLIEKSNATNRMGLLTPILSCRSEESLKRIVLEKYIDKYGRELSDYKDFRHQVIAETLDYLNSGFESPFNDIKISFYIGFFDDNIFFHAKKGG